MSIPYRPLGLLKELIESVGLDITYVHEDLAFIEHNAFLLQMGDEGKDVAIVFNTESNETARPEILERLTKAGTPLGFNIFAKGLFSMSQKEGDESFQLEFLESAP